MPDYDTMSVCELLDEYYRWCAVHDEGKIPREKLAKIESALRRAVLREATVGEVKVVTTEHFDEIARPEDPDRIVTMSEQLICQTWVPEGEYYLVKKEG